MRQRRDGSRGRVTSCDWVIAVLTCGYFKRRGNKEEAVKENGGKKKTEASSQQEGVFYHEKKGGRRGKLGEIRKNKRKGLRSFK